MNNGLVISSAGDETGALTLATGALNANGNDLTVSAKSNITGTMTCSSGTMSFASGYAGDYAVEVQSGGTFTGGSGTQTMGSFRILGGGSLTLSSGATIINSHNGSNISCRWEHNDTFDDGNGTTIFTRAGSQLLSDDDVGNYHFYNLIVNNAACTLQGKNASGPHVTVDNDFTVTSGTYDTQETDGGACRSLTVTGTTSITDTLDCGSSSITLSGNVTINVGGELVSTSGTMSWAGTTWTNDGTFTNSNGSVALTGTDQTINDSNTWHNFTKSVGVARTLTIDNASEQTFTGTIVINGAAGQLLSLISDSAGDAFNFTVTAAATKDTLNYLSVKDSDASNSDATQKPIAPTNSVDVSGNTSWWASGTEFTWTDNGSGNTNWNDQQNWADGVSGCPDDNTDKAVFDGTWDGDVIVNVAITVGKVSISSGYQHTITMSNNLTVDDGGGEDGSFTIADGSATLAVGANTLSVDGNLVHTNGSITVSTGTLDCNGDVTLSAGTIGSSNQAYSTDIEGAVTVGGGTLELPNSSGSCDFANNFTYSSGTVTHNSGTVVFSGASSTVSGTVTWYNITCGTSPGDTTFNNDQNIAGDMTIAAGDTVTLDCNANTVTLTFTNVAANPNLFINDTDALRSTNNATNYAAVTGNATKDVLISDPGSDSDTLINFDNVANGLWQIGYADIQRDQVTGGGGVNVTVVNGCSMESIVITANDTLTGTADKVLTLTDENGDGDTLHNNGTISGDLDVTFTYGSITNCYTGGDSMRNVAVGSGAAEQCRIYWYEGGGITGTLTINGHATNAQLRVASNFDIGGATTVTVGYLVNYEYEITTDDINIGASGALSLSAASGASTVTMDDGSTLANSGVITPTGNTTNHAVIQAEVGGAATITGTQPDWDAGGAGSYVDIARIDLQQDNTTGGGGVTVEVLDDITTDSVTISAGDTLKCTTQDKTLTAAAGKIVLVYGSLQLNGASGHDVTMTGYQQVQIVGGATIDLQYVTISATNNALYIGYSTNITLTQIDHCTLSSTTFAAAYVYNYNTTVPLLTNCTIDGGDGSTWLKCDVAIYQSKALELDGCTLSNSRVGLYDTGGWVVSKNHGGVSKNCKVWGIMNATSPDAGYRLNTTDLASDSDVDICYADAYSSAFDTVLTQDADTNFDTLNTAANTSWSVNAGVTATVNPGGAITNAGSISYNGTVASPVILTGSGYWTMTGTRPTVLCVELTYCRYTGDGPIYYGHRKVVRASHCHGLKKSVGPMPGGVQPPTYMP